MQTELVDLTGDDVVVTSLPAQPLLLLNLDGQQTPPHSPTPLECPPPLSRPPSIELPKIHSQIDNRLRHFNPTTDMDSGESDSDSDDSQSDLPIPWNPTFEETIDKVRSRWTENEEMTPEIERFINALLDFHEGYFECRECDEELPVRGQQGYCDKCAMEKKAKAIAENSRKRRQDEANRSTMSKFRKLAK
jgi:hypothetical protein